MDVVSEEHLRTNTCMFFILLSYFNINKEPILLEKIINKLSESGLHRSKTGFVDIGSNLGWFSLNMASNGYRVFSFEAEKVNGEM